MNEYCQPLGNTLYNARTEQGLTLDSIAEALDLDYRTISSIEHHTGNPKLEVLYKLIRYMRLDPVACFYPELNEERPELHKLQLLLADCSQKELDALYTVCKTVLNVMRSADTAKVE